MTNSTYFTPQTVLAVGAHADDIDVMAGGSLLRWAQEGARIVYLILTDGSHGSTDPHATTQQVAETRQAEQRAAAKLVGTNDVTFLSYEDCCLDCSLDVKREIVRVIRRVKPDTVVGMDPQFMYSSQLGIINHSDHRAAGQATLDAVFPLARDHLSFPELLHDEQLAPHRVEKVLLANFENHTYYVDVSAQFDQKLALIAAHASQFTDLASIEAMLATMAENLGAKTGSRYAEGFMRIDLAY